MDNRYLKDLLDGVADGRVSVDQALTDLKELPFDDLDFVKIDEHRNLRTGYPEVIFCQGKQTGQIIAIIKKMRERNSNIIGTRASQEVFEAVKKEIPDAVYHSDARIISIRGPEGSDSRSASQPQPASGSSDRAGTIAVVTAGTADIPVAEEAAITAELFGNPVDRIYDVGVAGIHRLFAQLPRIRAANVIIVIAGMEGALASVVGGLVERPVIAVPTSVGYGASFGGVSALLTMLNSCAAGVGVVNIDNGFGAAYLASTINQG